MESRLQISNPSNSSGPLACLHMSAFALENRVKEDVERRQEREVKVVKVSLGSSQINHKLMSGSQ